MVSRSSLFDECRKDLEKSGNPDARFDVLCIFQDMLNDAHPLFRPSETVDVSTELRIRDLIEKRRSGYPLQYLLGQWEFFGCPVKVGEGVLIPRPDTETLVEQILDICSNHRLTSPVIADLCSGSGCIAIPYPMNRSRRGAPSLQIHSPTPPRFSDVRNAHAPSPYISQPSPPHHSCSSSPENR